MTIGGALKLAPVRPGLFALQSREKRFAIKAAICACCPKFVE
jgi:uncharacterized protein (DUF779 family)